ncbi:MAG: M20/M25/M40 family metallo-hydrolase, partial [Anaerolineales bacterium]|nr:M20/M25/M40 family metallo-hydrolase [Anaerolineales bacterium]
VVLLFQPAEETGTGAQQVLGDVRFQDIRPDYIFALHNLPGYPFGRVLIREDVFSCASRGMVVKLMGVSSHAAYPEHGRSPAGALAEIIQGLSQLPEQLNGFTLVTVIHARLGEIAFGTAPGYAEVMATLRSDQNDHMERLAQEAVELVTHTAQKHGLDAEISWRDSFAATVNHGEAVKIVEEAARA